MNSPVLPAYVPPREALSRPTATSISRTQEQRESTLTITGLNEVIPLTYGEDRISGLWIVRPYTHIGTGELRFAMLWGWGPAEGVQDVYINGADVPVGVTMTHYTGEPGQGIDPILGADIPGFGDVFEGCAYTVFRVPPNAISGFPQTCQVEAVFRGLKVLDERTGITAWSQNPGVCLADFVNSSRYGPGMKVYGAPAVANRCDSIVGDTEVRCQIGITISEPHSLDALVDLLSAYAECLWSYSADGILLIPDAPVDTEIAAEIDRDDIVENTLQLMGSSLASAPTVITVVGRRSTGTAEQWIDTPATWQAAGVDTGDTPEIRSDVTMPGIRRTSEMLRKAVMRGTRLQFPARYAWQMYDRGVIFDRGDVVKLPDTRGLMSWFVRILSNEMVAHGMYQITAEHYDESMYPDDYIPGDEVPLPVGAGVPFHGTDLPNGFEWFTDADGLYLVGAGDEYEPGPVEGSFNYEINGQTSYEPDHDGSIGILPRRYFAPGGSFPYRNPQDVPGGGHDHSYNLIASRIPQYRQDRIIVKTGVPGDVPKDAGVWCNGPLLSPSYQSLQTHLGRLLRAGDPGQGGQALTFNSAIALTPSGAHDHLGPAFFPGQWIVDAGPSAWYEMGSVADHTHSASIPTEISLPRIRLASYIATANTPITVGAIVIFLQDELPPGWHWANGQNGTVNMEGAWLERSSVADAGQIIPGDKKIKFSGNTSVGGEHQHGGPLNTAGTVTTADGAHPMGASHYHQINDEADYVPPSYAFRFIQYTGVE